MLLIECRHNRETAQTSSPVDHDRLCLPQSMGAGLRLQVVVRVPIAVINDHLSKHVVSAAERKELRQHRKAGASSARRAMQQPMVLPLPS
jgi:hypothetical protein